MASYCYCNVFYYYYSLLGGQGIGLLLLLCLLGGQIFGILLLLLCLLLFHQGFHPFPMGLHLRDFTDSCGLCSSRLDKNKNKSQGHMSLKVAKKVFFYIFSLIPQKVTGRFVLNLYRMYIRKIGTGYNILVHVATHTSAGHGSKVRNFFPIFFYLTILIFLYFFPYLGCACASKSEGNFLTGICNKKLWPCEKSGRKKCFFPKTTLHIVITSSRVSEDAQPT